MLPSDHQIPGNYDLLKGVFTCAAPCRCRAAARALRKGAFGLGSRPVCDAMRRRQFVFYFQNLNIETKVKVGDANRTIQDNKSVAHVPGGPQSGHR